MKIYVICPPSLKTGGTELAHQLVKKLNDLNFNAIIAYPKCDSDNYINPGFLKYVNSFSLVDDIEDELENIIIIPEGMTNYSKKFEKSKVYIWWMSVDNYFYPPKFKYAYLNGGIKRLLKEVVRRIIRYNYKSSKSVPISKMKNVEKHLVQSQYAYEFLKKNGINNKKIAFLSDYINDDYITNSKDIDLTKKENIVIFNPKKGYKFTKRIIDSFKDVTFVPIINMTNQQVVDLMKRAKIYIDFGCHPGKDRIPREAAMMKCCVITGKKGSAKYYEDVMIDSQFKFDENRKEIFRLKNMILDIFENYSSYIEKFCDYRDKISREKSIFENEVLDIFK